MLSLYSPKSHEIHIGSQNGGLGNELIRVDAGLGNGVLFNQKLAHELLDTSSEPGKFYEEAYKVIIY